MWKVKHQSFKNPNLLKVKSVTFFLSLLKPSQNQLLLKLSVFLKLLSLGAFIKNNSYNLKKIDYSSKFVTIKGSSKSFQKSKFALQEYSKNSLITTFLNVNLWIPTAAIEVHPSFSSLYFYNNQSNLGIFNLKKVFNVWLNVLNFITNILSYGLNYLFFSSSYFKYESLSMNWNTNNKFRSIWRYNNPFIFFLKNKTTRVNDIFFKYLSRNVSKLIIIVDVYYHKRTLHYFNKYKFITLGPVPVTSSLYSLSLAFPVSSNSVFSNLFFIRMFMRLKKLLATYSYRYLVGH